MKTTITVKGTHCRACKALIEDVCGDFREVASCRLDYETGTAEIEHGDQLNWEDLKKEIESLGNYKVELTS